MAALNTIPSCTPAPASVSAPALSPWEHQEAAERAASPSDLAETMSPSQVSTFTECGAKYWFRYGLKLPDPKTSALTLGSAVDEAINANFELKIESGKDLPLEDVLLEFEAAWGQLEDETEFRQDEDPAAIAQTGRSLISVFMQEAAPGIQPAGVQVPVSGLIGGVQVNGVIDLIDSKARIRDVKTASKRSKSIAARDLFQLSTYALLAPHPTVDVTIDQLVKTKTPAYNPLSQRLTSQDLQLPKILYPLAQESIRSGYFLPNRNSPMCTRKQCGFWRACEREFGGTVQGGEE